jgi:hypothetical protein
VSGQFVKNNDGHCRSRSFAQSRVAEDPHLNGWDEACVLVEGLAKGIGLRR